MTKIKKERLICSAKGFELPEDCWTEDDYRKTAVFTVIVCTVAVTTCCLALPMIYNHVQFVHSQLQDEIDFCMVCSFEVVLYNLPTCYRSHNYKFRFALQTSGKNIPN